jgi:hypothetical protein
MNSQGQAHLLFVFVFIRTRRRSVRLPAQRLLQRLIAHLSRSPAKNIFICREKKNNTADSANSTANIWNNIPVPGSI